MTLSIKMGQESSRLRDTNISREIWNEGTKVLNSRRNKLYSKSKLIRMFGSTLRAGIKSKVLHGRMIAIVITQ